PWKVKAQSIHWLAMMRGSRSIGRSTPLPYLSPSQRMIVCDSQMMKPSSSTVGTRPLGFILRYSGVLTTPKFRPASMRSYCKPSSSSDHSTFLTLTELTRPQTLIIDGSSETRGLTVATGVARRKPAAVHLPDHLAAAELVVVVHGNEAMAALAQFFHHRG